MTILGSNSSARTIAALFMIYPSASLLAAASVQASVHKLVRLRQRQGPRRKSGLFPQAACPASQAKQSDESVNQVHPLAVARWDGSGHPAESVYPVHLVDKSAASESLGPRMETGGGALRGAGVAE